VVVDVVTGIDLLVDDALGNGTGADTGAGTT